MRLEFGATVRSADGETVGTVDQLVIDGNTRAVTDLLLRCGRFFHRDLLVPIDTIAREDDDNTIHLTLDSARVRALPAFEEENFVVAEHPGEAQWRYLMPVTLAGGAPPAFTTGPTVEGMRAYDPARGGLLDFEDPSGEVVESLSNLPEWDYRESRGTKVVTRDDHAIGTLHEVDVDADGKPQAIVVATGLLHRGHRTIPIARVRTAGAERIVLNLTKAEYEQLPAGLTRAAPVRHRLAAR